MSRRVLTMSSNRCTFKLSITVDDESFPVPTDGNITQELQEILNDLLYDVDGLESFNITQLNGRRR